MKYFKSGLTIEELKKAYKEKVKELHPDRGGSETDFKELQMEYTLYQERLNTGETEETKESNYQEMEIFRKIINKLINYIDIEIEICGKWLWISGNTKPIKDILKELGCFWASKKCMWYWRPPEAASRNRKTASMEYIREHYGSDKIKPKTNIIAG
jgi:hypothetical protein